MGKINIGTLAVSKIFAGSTKVKKIFIGNIQVYASMEPFVTPTLTLSGNILSTPIVEGVTKYKVYDNGTYIGYIDSDNVWHGEVSE